MISQTLINPDAYRIVGCAFEVHRHPGPGLPESVYQSCFLKELTGAGLTAFSQVYVPVIYKGSNLGGLFKLDILVNNLILVEVKATEGILPLYKAQLLSYLKLAGKLKGLLINFNCVSITKEGLVPLVKEEFAKLSKQILSVAPWP